MSSYGVEASCNRVLLWGWIPQEFLITLKSCIIFVPCCDSETAIHTPPHKCVAVAVCPTNAHGPAGTWNAAGHISDVPAFQQQSSWRWRVSCGLVWVLSVSGRDVLHALHKPNSVQLKHYQCTFFFSYSHCCTVHIASIHVYFTNTCTCESHNINVNILILRIKPLKLLELPTCFGFS